VLIAAMFYSFACVSAVLKLKVDDYYHNGARRRLRLHENGISKTFLEILSNVVHGNRPKKTLQRKGRASHLI
jgi:hypothetical protein